MNRPSRIFFYAVNGLGLGHITRCLAVARQLVKEINVIPIFITSSEASHLLYQEGFPHFKLPSKNSASSIGMKKYELQLSYQLIIQNLLAVFRPSLIVVDTFPLGLMGELFGILQLENGIPRILIQRKVKTARANDHRIRQQGFYNHIIVPHNENEGPFHLREEIQKTFTGPILIRDKEEMLPREKALELLYPYPDRGKRKNLYVNLGGGGDSELEAGIQSIQGIARSFPEINFFMPRPPLAKKRMAPRQDNVIVFDYYPVMEIMQAFDFSISACGYNSYHELLASEVPTIFFPQERGFDDQAERARMGSANDLCIFLDSFSEPEKIKEAIIKLQDESIRNKITANLQKNSFENGAHIAAKVIAGYLRKNDENIKEPRI